MFLTFIFISIIYSCGAINNSIESSPREVTTNHCGDTNQLSGYWQADYNTTNFTCALQFDQYYQVKITIEEFELDPTTIYIEERKSKTPFQDFVKITPIETNESDGTSIILFGFVNKTTYVVLSNQVLFEFYTHPNSDSDTYAGFKIKWERYGELPTTTLPTTTTELIPTPGKNESGTYVGYVYGPRPEQTKNSLPLLKKTLSMKAQDYCIENNMDLEKNITEENVVIRKVIRCNVLWPESDVCTEVHFEIPIRLNGSDKYELNAEHLRVIWDRLANSELPKGWVKYVVPDNGRNFLYWLIISCVIVVVFFAFLFVVRYVQPYFLFEDGQNQMVVSDFTPRQSELNWPNQVIPPLFDSVDDYHYSNMRTSYANPSFVDDEFSDEEILNVNNFTKRTNYKSFNE